jgi:hypothetical protein
MPPFRNLMYAYLHACLKQVMVSVACNGAQSLKQRLARWLLMVRDHSDGGAHFPLLKICSPACSVCNGQPSQTLPVSWSVQV